MATYRYVVQFSQTASSATDTAEGDALVQNQPVLVLLLQLNELGEVGHSTIMVKDTFRHDETTCQGSPALLALLLHALEDVLKALHVIVIVPPNRAARDLETLLNGKVDTSVCHYYITAFAKSRYNRADS